MHHENMTSHERLVAAIHGREVDHVPFSPFLAYVWESFPKEVQAAGHLAFYQAIGADPLWRGAPCPVKAVLPPEVETRKVDIGDTITTTVTTPVGTLSSNHVRSKQAQDTAFLVEHPLKTPEDFKIQQWIEEHTVYEPNLGAARDHLSGDGRHGLSLGMILPSGKSAYQQMVEHYVGTEELIYAQVDYPEVVRELWETMVENDLKALDIALESDYQYFTTWEDSSTQNYSPTQYDEFIGSEIGTWCRCLASAGKHYVQHACGHVHALVERMRDHGVFAVESMSPPPTGNLTVKEARAKLGRDMGIIGGIEPTLFLNLPTEKLGPYVESVIEDARGGPFILANSDSCPPGVTVEKFRIVAEVAAGCRG